MTTALMHKQRRYLFFFCVCVYVLFTKGAFFSLSSQFCFLSFFFALAFESFSRRTLKDKKKKENENERKGVSFLSFYPND